jgi:alpha/beta superfamily hydrolase
MVTTAAVELMSGTLRLEGALYSPAVTARSAVVVCHPHPQPGGGKHNKLVITLVRAAVESGNAALTFNFRGVGASEGAYEGGAGERDDARAAIGHARSLPGIERVALAGYSFGAGIAAGIADASITALCLVSVSSAAIGTESPVHDFAGPVLIACGDLDHVASLEAIEATAAASAGDVEVLAVPGADHFWRGHEGILLTSVEAFFERVLAQA